MSQFPWDKILSFSASDLVKFGISAAVIVIVTKIQIFNDRLSALLIALPLTSLVAMIWMHLEKQTPERVANHASGTFWFVLPTLPMFLILPWMLRNGWGFWAALAANAVITVGLFWVTVFTLRRFGIDLMPK